MKNAEGRGMCKWRVWWQWLVIEQGSKASFVEPLCSISIKAVESSCIIACRCNPTPVIVQVYAIVGSYCKRNAGVCWRESGD